MTKSIFNPTKRNRIYVLSKDWVRHGKASGYQRVSEYFSIIFKYAKKIKLPFFLSEYFKSNTRIKNYQSNTLSKEFFLLFKIFTAKIIHVQYGDMDFYYLHYIKKFPFNLRKNKLIVTFHHPPYELEKRLKYNRKKVLGAIDKIIVMGENQIPFFRKYSNAEIKFIPHGINLNHFCINDSVKRLDQILLVGTTHRDHDRNVKIIQGLNAVSNVSIKIVMFEEHTHYYKNLENVEIFTRNITDEELLHLYQSSKGLLMSLKDCTASNAILEAMGCGCPLIINDVGAVRDYLFDDTIKIFAAEDIKNSILFILNIIKDENLLNSIIDKQIKIVQNYSWEKVSNETEKFIISE